MPKKIKKKTEVPTPAEPLMVRNKNMARKIMWLGVVLFSGAIIATWSWALAKSVVKINLAKTPEKQLLTSTKTDWNKIFADTKAEAQKKMYLDKIKNKIAEIVATTATTSAVATSTFNTTTTLK
ncbi:MAG: hypothetical protein Q7S66_04460 [bacterium]|nr:hypothetical protein [bacterium]